MTDPTIKIGEFVLEIRDPDNMAPVVVDLIIENRSFDNSLALSVASVISDGDNSKPYARVVARLRIARAIIPDLQRALAQALEPPPPPPKEQVN